MDFYFDVYYLTHAKEKLQEKIKTINLCSKYN